MMFLPRREDVVVRDLLERRAMERPDDLFLRFEDGEEWTFSVALEQARRAAAGLASLGVAQGDKVFSWLPSGPAAVRTWLGVNYLGAVHVPANTAYRGTLLAHVLALSDAVVGVVHADLLPRLEELDGCPLQHVILVGETNPISSSLSLHPASVLEADRQPPPLTRPIEFWDPMVILFTSGTTGPSKGVLCPYTHLWQSYFEGKPALIGRDHVVLVHLPLFHNGGLGCIYGQLANGGVAVVVGAFRTEQFWDTIRRHGITSVSLLGAMIPFLMGRPPGPEDRNHSLRSGVAAPYTEQALAFSGRFGVDLCPSYGMTELSGPIRGVFNTDKFGACGKLRPGHDVRLVDDNDIEVPVGEVGEAVIRCDLPWMMFTEYYKNPEATAEAWRNGWFHTGDLLRRDAEGDFYFVDRKKDALRRRGENISAYEVEQEILSHPDVMDVAVVATKSLQSEDEVLACIVAVEGKSVNLVDLTLYLAGRMPHYMVPRYLRIMQEFPRTPTQKIQKYALREQGVTSDTWDREAAGIQLKQQRLRAI